MNYKILTPENGAGKILRGKNPIPSWKIFRKISFRKTFFYF